MIEYIIERNPVSQWVFPDDGDYDACLEPPEKPIRFTGALLAENKTIIHRPLTIPVEIEIIRELYVTKGGNYICVVKRSNRDRPRIKIVKTEEDIFNFFGRSKDSIELYEKAGMDYTSYKYEYVE